MPMRRPVVGVAAAIAFMVSWGNLIDPLLYVYDERWFTLPLGLASLAELPSTDHGLLLAAAVLAIVPVLVTAFVIQRFAIRQEGGCRRGPPGTWSELVDRRCSPSVAGAGEQPKARPGSP